MRLSDAIAMGRVLIKPAPGYIYDAARNQGCALGMAGKAVGETNLASDGFFITRRWPWAGKLQLLCPCTCGHVALQCPVDIIVHLFDSHVFHGLCRAPKTLDELIDWVRTNEPPEPGELSTPEQEVSLRIQSTELSSRVLA